MATLQKLAPDHDLQCYFSQPSGVAALSQTSASGFTVSGCWRQQSDWAVVEWNRDNVFEHPMFRNLPDGDLSGVKLSYEETRTNCIPLDSMLYSTVDWPYLRVWADPGTGEQIYWIRLKDYARPVEGVYKAATATFQLQGSPLAGDYAELVCQDEHYTYQFGTDLVYAVETIAGIVNAGALLNATSQGTRITVSWRDQTAGANANRTGLYASATGAETWTPQWQTLSGGTSPAKWRIDLDFSSVVGFLTPHPTAWDVAVSVPMHAVRKMRWTWAADLQPGNFVRSEFAVAVSNWTVSGVNLEYSVAGPGSWRVEDDDQALTYTGQWTLSRGNYSGGSISYATDPGASVGHSYQSPQAHHLYLGTRRAPNCAAVSVEVDGGPIQTLNLALGGEDVLVRWDLGELAGGVPHRVVAAHAGQEGEYFYFDFLEVVVAATDLPVIACDSETTLATDWDTLHSQALAPERTAWLIQALGFSGRANHYAGALWFYELCSPGQQYASSSVNFSGNVQFGYSTQLSLSQTVLTHTNFAADTAASVAKAFELSINEGSTGVWAQASGSQLTITSRAMGTAGNGLTVVVDTGGSTMLQAQISGPLSGGVDGAWVTDLAATPRLNRAARDWSQSYFTALKNYGIVATASFSTELGNGDPSAAAGIAQRYPDGSACMVNTPALQTNFSEQSLAFWQQVYLDMAAVMAQAGQQPYLQFGEVQWWYFCPPKDPANGDWTPIPNGGMPFYDPYTTSQFQSRYNEPMHEFRDPSDDPAKYPNETAFLPGLIGNFTRSIMAFVRQTYPDALFEVLYPPDTNRSSLMQAVNLPSSWNPENLTTFKTENFSYTGMRDLNRILGSAALPILQGFTRPNGAHLIGIGDYTTPWQEEWRIGEGLKLGSVVLWALDQCCLTGYRLPLTPIAGRSLFMGS